MSDNEKILVVDDEESIRDMLRVALQLAGFEFLEAADVDEAWEIVRKESPDLVLLDWMLPGGSGVDLLRKLRKKDRTVNLPVIMLTAKSHEDNVVQGFDVGADDYVTKPFAPRELIARIRSILRRKSEETPKTKLVVELLSLDTEAKRVEVDKQRLKMGPTEFKLLEFFMSHPEKAYSRSQLLDFVWGINVYVEDRTVDVHIRRLRKILHDCDPRYSSLIQTVRGTGYRFSPGDLAES